jgi:hypothetical protein
VSLSGCQGLGETETGTDPVATERDGQPTETEAPEVEPDVPFDQIYRNTIQDTGVETDDLDLSDASTISEEFAIVNDHIIGSETGYFGEFRDVVHNQLEYGTDEVRIFERKTSSGESYAAIMIKQDGDWVKDLALYGNGDPDNAYLRHDEESLDASDEKLLNGMWSGEASIGSSLAFEQATEDIHPENASSEEEWQNYWEEASKEMDLHNDCLVVSQDPDIAEIGYTLEVRGRMSDLASFNDNISFNGEVEMVENATEFYHNELGDGYMQVDVTKESLGENEHELTEFDDGAVMYATEVDAEIHRENIGRVYNPRVEG